MVTYKKPYVVILEIIFSFLMTIVTSMITTVVSLFVYGDGSEGDVDEDEERKPNNWKPLAKLTVFFILITLLIALILNFDTIIDWVEEFRSCV